MRADRLYSGPRPSVTRKDPGNGDQIESSATLYPTARNSSTTSRSGLPYTSGLLGRHFRFSHNCTSLEKGRSCQYPKSGFEMYLGLRSSIWPAVWTDRMFATYRTERCWHHRGHDSSLGLSITIDYDVETVKTQLETAKPDFQAKFLGLCLPLFPRHLLLSFKGDSKRLRPSSNKLRGTAWVWVT